MGRQDEYYANGKIISFFYAPNASPAECILIYLVFPGNKL
jgi:hypothetical protein